MSLTDTGEQALPSESHPYEVTAPSVHPPKAQLSDNNPEDDTEYD